MATGSIWGQGAAGELGRLRQDRLTNTIDSLKGIMDLRQVVANIKSSEAELPAKKEEFEVRRQRAVHAQELMPKERKLLDATYDAKYKEMFRTMAEQDLEAVGRLTEGVTDEDTYQEALGRMQASGVDPEELGLPPVWDKQAQRRMGQLRKQSVNSLEHVRAVELARMQYEYSLRAAQIKAKSSSGSAGDLPKELGLYMGLKQLDVVNSGAGAPTNHAETYLRYVTGRGKEDAIKTMSVAEKSANTIIRSYLAKNMPDIEPLINPENTEFNPGLAAQIQALEKEFAVGVLGEMEEEDIQLNEALIRNEVRLRDALNSGSIKITGGRVKESFLGMDWLNPDTVEPYRVETNIPTISIDDYPE